MTEPDDQPPTHAPSNVGAPEPSQLAESPKAVYISEFDAGKLVARIELAEKKANDLESHLFDIYGGATALLALTSLLAVAAWRYTKDKITNLLAAEVEKIRHQSDSDKKTAINELISEAKSDLGNAVLRMQHDYLKFAQVLSYVEAKQYDAALRAAEFQQQPTAEHFGLPVEIQIALVKALSRSARLTTNEETEEVAWSWISQLAERHPSKTTLRSLLEVGSRLAREDETIDQFDEKKSHLNDEEISELDPVLLVVLRRARKNRTNQTNGNRIIETARKLKDTSDFSTIVNVSAIYRDYGKLDLAESMLLTAMDRARNSPDGYWEESFGRLYSTHIANCIDLGKPQDALDDARVLLSQVKRPDQVFICVRLAWKHKTPNDTKTFICSAVESRMRDGYLASHDDGTWKSRALILDMQGKRNEAISLTEGYLRRLDSGKKEKWKQKQIYFLRCFLAELLSEGSGPEDSGKALKHLEPVLTDDNKGEASYLAAIVCAQLNSNEASIRHLKRSVSAGLRWVAKAKNHHLLKTLPEVNELFVTHSIGL